jgi:hypothetical protein
MQTHYRISVFYNPSNALQEEELLTKDRRLESLRDRNFADGEQLELVSHPILVCRLPVWALTAPCPIAGITDSH